MVIDFLLSNQSMEVVIDPQRCKLNAINPVNKAAIPRDKSVQSFRNRQPLFGKLLESYIEASAAPLEQLQNNKLCENMLQGDVFTPSLSSCNNAY